MIHKTALLGLVLFVGLAAALDVERDTIEKSPSEMARSKRWWGLGGWGLGLGYGLGYPFYGGYGFYGKRAVDEEKRDLEIDAHVNKMMKRSIESPLENTELKERETAEPSTRSKRWWGLGYGGWGLGGLGWGFPYYGLYGKRSAEPSDARITKRDLETIKERELSETPRSKRWWGGYGLGLGGWGLGGLGWGFPYYGLYGKRSAEMETSVSEEKSTSGLTDLGDISSGNIHSVNKRDIEPMIENSDMINEENGADGESSRAKRWWGRWGGRWGGWGRWGGLGGFGGWGYPYYGFYGKRDTSSVNDETMMTAADERETDLSRREEEIAENNNEEAISPDAMSDVESGENDDAETDNVDRQRRFYNPYGSFRGRYRGYGYGNFGGFGNGRFRYLHY